MGLCGLSNLLSSVEIFNHKNFNNRTMNYLELWKKWSHLVTFSHLVFFYCLFAKIILQRDVHIADITQNRHNQRWCTSFQAGVLFIRQISGMDVHFLHPERHQPLGLPLCHPELLIVGPKVLPALGALGNFRTTKPARKASIKLI